jgi:hypothetical protein
LTSRPDDGIVVDEVGKGDAEMESNIVPTALQERLGSEATHDLVRLFETARFDWTADVVSLSLERFERRLVEELARLRIEMAQEGAGLREKLAQQGAVLQEKLAQQGAVLQEKLAQQGARLQEKLAQQGAGLEEKLAQQGASLRAEIAAVRTDLKSDMQEGFASIRQEMATNRFELLKWSFLFWIGQVLAIVGLVGTMLRAFGLAR